MKIRENANAAILEGDIFRVQIEKLRKIDKDMSNVACVVAANLVEERNYFLGGDLGKVEAILAIEERAGFAVDSLVRTEEPGCKLLLWIVIRPRSNRPLAQYYQLIYLVSKLAGEAKEARRCVRCRRLLIFVSCRDSVNASCESDTTDIAFEGSSYIRHLSG